jgi:DNA processing protein
MSAPDRELVLSLLALARVTEPGSRPVFREVAALGAPAVWHALRRGRPCGSLSPALRAGAAARAENYDPADELARLQAAGGRLVAPGQPEWPDDRLGWPDGTLQDAPPLALCVRGPHSLAEVAARSVAVVGARAATAYGSSVAGELACALAGRGTAVVSGGAYGIDAAAHRGALVAQGAPTVAVLACGVDIAYPRGNDRLLGRIAEQGLVVSEVAPGSPPTRARFLVRNRLIAALTLGTVVVEAARRSGSLATADRARALSRHVMAVPGPVTSALSEGCHQLLRDGAACVTGAADVLDLTGALGSDASERLRGPTTVRDGLSETVRRVLDAVPVRGGAGEAVLAREAGVSPLVVQQVLPPLLAHGLVQRCPEGWRLTALGAGRPAPGRR